ncbi:DUF2381 family protein [Pyxidicoccus trucidator]|uniref:DUF2381 family protein n=1 Tax=Pyxidicoccus trucidator TaxID=2709662 RepID=UPI0013DD24BD|nr:DUF2381 family protein [Pyxidicoccus trucidator]
MLALPPAVLLALVLSGPVAAVPEAVTCREGVRHIELPAVPAGELLMACISPGRPTLFSFDAELLAGSLSLEGSDDFSLVEVGPSTLKLIPSEKLNAGARRQVRVGFKDGAAPRSAVFVLAVQAAQADPLVNVYRQARTVESYQQELAEQEAEARQCREENARLRGEKHGPGGLVGLRAAGLMEASGVTSRDIFSSVSLTPTDVLRVEEIVVYRSAQRVAVEVRLRVPEDAPAWVPEGASLLLQGKKGVELKVLKLWPPEPIAPGQKGGRVFVEAEAPADAVSGPYTLKLWDASGARVVTLRGATFP